MSIRIITFIIIITLTLIFSYFGFQYGYKNYKQLIPIVCGSFMVVCVIKIMTFVIHFINGFAGWKSILNG